ncbi:helix-turn-helix domain-containing protein [Sneathiella glossodoripedis]|uniref:helix-turn-helix domain-containing protein n=1 Tax=Sneathiella glossodoripedis TaxID=418853 RepID=UPI0004706FD6|nr:XRE family transcriptional regulator [Sneathiella glossodoripedis]
METDLTERLAKRLKELRIAQSYSLEDLANRCGISRATLSRMENADVSPTTDMLSKLCAAYGLTLTHLLSMVEETYAPCIRRADQPVWEDAQIGFLRRSLSPPSKALKGELLECEIAAGQVIQYDRPTIPGLEHHLYVVSGSLSVTIDGNQHDLTVGDCLRYHSNSPTRFETTNSPAKYILALI